MAKRKWLRPLLVSVALVLGLMLAVSIIVPRAGLADKIQAVAEDATGAEVSLKSLRVAWGSGFGVVLHDGKWTGTGKELFARQGFGADIGAYQFTFSELKLKLSLVALLRNRVEFSAVEISGSMASATLSGDEYALQNYKLVLSDVVAPMNGSITGDNITCELALQCDGFTSQWGEYSNLVMDGEWLANQLHLPEVSGILGTGQVSADVVLDFRGEGPGKIAGKVQLQAVGAPELLGPFWPDLAQKLQCHLSGDLTGSMSLGDSVLRRQSLDLIVNMSADEGVLDARQWFAEASSYLGDRQDLKMVSFESLSHRGQIAADRYEIETLLLEGPETSWHGSGWVEFVGQLQVGVDVRLPQGFTPDLGSMAFLAEMLRDKQGRMNLAASISGPTSEPVVAADIQRMLGGR